MTKTIALAGKGGVGKTTLAALMIKYLVQEQPRAILAIDADPSSNLNIVLGLDLEWTVGDIREGMLEQVKTSLTSGGAAMGTMPGGVSKRDYLDYHVHTALAEGSRFDLIAMGRGEGPGCYCAVNHNLREVVDAISKQYAYVIIDNEAGMEHLSRRTTRDVQHLLIVSDPTPRGLIAAHRIAAMSRELEINIEKTWLVLNRSAGQNSPQVNELVADVGAPLLGAVPADDGLRELEASDRPLIDIGNESPAYRAVGQMLLQILGDRPSSAAR